MGLLSILKKIREKERNMRILILGLDNAGKTTLLKQVNGEPIDTVSPTVGFNIKTLEHKGFTLNIWDVGGQKTIRGFWRNYFEDTDGLVWTIDCSDHERLLLGRDELNNLLRQEKLIGTSVLIFANKQDLSGALSKEKVIELLDLDSPVYGNRHVKVFPCSAVTGDGLREGFDWIVSDIASRIYIDE